MKKPDIEARARGVLEAHGLIEMAVDPIRLANSLGIKVYNAKFGEADVHGLLAIRGGVPAIYVNADDSAVRKRFTVAHEIGHMNLHLTGGDVEFIDNADSFRSTIDPDSAWTEQRRKEWEANIFAAALLMPDEQVRRRWVEIGDPEGMARWFQVSRTAMDIRLEGLGLLAA
ncbi:MAG TPA: ImmA/IrrE family metallo-endopeptidase [Gemmatimonadaceae bacterium]|jgi:Zn-dependent peptidase ImmA (M78 family)